MKEVLLALVTISVASFGSPLLAQEEPVRPRKEVKNKVDLPTQQKEVKMIMDYYRKLSATVWDSEGGQERQRELGQKKTQAMPVEFFQLMGLKKEQNIHPCALLSNSREPVDSPKGKIRSDQCMKFVSTFRLLLPYLRRNAEVDKCGGPINCLKQECDQPQYYSDAIQYGFNVASVECWLPCSSLIAYADAKLPVYDEALKKFGQAFEEEKKRKLEAARLAEEERKRKMATIADRERRAKLKASIGCRAADFAKEVCSGNAMVEDAKKRLEEEKSAQAGSGLSSQEVLRNLEAGILIANEALKGLQAKYEKAAGEEFPIKSCDGWIRGPNPSHPVYLDVNVKCGY